MASTLHHLVQTLETVAGVEEAEAFLSTVGTELGQELCNDQTAQLGEERFQREMLPDVLVGAETDIGAAFKVIERNENHIVLENSTCPFGPQVEGTRSACMITANLLGHLASKSTGYAKIHLEKTIARGDGFCRVNVSLEDTPSPGLEYFADV